MEQDAARISPRTIQHHCSTACESVVVSIMSKALPMKSSDIVKDRRKRSWTSAFLFNFFLTNVSGFVGLASPTTKTLHRNKVTHLHDTPIPLVSHHIAVKTRNITTAIQFYSLLDFAVECKFRAGPARAAWLRQAPSSRIELIEVPSHLLNEPEGMKRRAMNLMERQELLGWNHLALDVTESLQSKGFTTLSEWMQDLNTTSIDRFGLGLRVALEPRQQIIGNGVYELAFLYDADGALVEFIHRQSDVEQEMTSGWDIWDGTGFV